MELRPAYALCRGRRICFSGGGASNSARVEPSSKGELENPLQRAIRRSAAASSLKQVDRTTRSSARIGARRHPEGAQCCWKSRRYDTLLNYTEAGASEIPRLQRQTQLAG